MRRVCVENAAPVQYGDLLFELEPLVAGRSTRSVIPARRPHAVSTRDPSPATRFQRTVKSARVARGMCQEPRGTVTPQRPPPVFAAS